MSKASRPSLRASLPPVADEAAKAAARAQEMLRRQSAELASAEMVAPQVAMTTSTIHLPVELLVALRDAANRRADRKMRDDPRGRGGRPSVSEIVVELLVRHRDELESMN